MNKVLCFINTECSCFNEYPELIKANIECESRLRILCFFVSERILNAGKQLLSPRNVYN